MFVRSLWLIVLLRRTTQRDSTDTGKLNFANMHRKRIPPVLFGHFYAILHRDTECVSRPQDISAMIFQLSSRHIALTVCVVFPHGYEIIEKVNLSVLSYVICISAE